MTDFAQAPREDPTAGNPALPQDGFPQGDTTSSPAPRLEPGRVRKPLTKSQIKSLRTLAQPLKPLVIIGKNNVTDAVANQVDQTLEGRELVKVQVLGESDVSSAEAAAALADRLHAAVISVMGKRAVLYRRSRRNDIDHIRLGV